MPASSIDPQTSAPGALPSTAPSSPERHGEDGTVRELPARSPADVVRARVAHSLSTAQVLCRAGHVDEARSTLRRLVRTYPGCEEPWLALLALDPDLDEEIELLEGFLRQHLGHRFAPAFRARLQDMRVVTLLSEQPRGDPAAALPVEPSLRLGDYLVGRGWVAPEQVEHALAEQRRLKQRGIERRLGTLLLQLGYLQPEQLAAGLSASSPSGFGEFGNYLVRSGVLTPAQIGEALARQAMVAVAQEQAFEEELRSHHRIRRLLPLGRWSRPPQRQPAPKLGEVLVMMGLLTSEQVETLLRERLNVLQAAFQ